MVFNQVLGPKYYNIHGIWALKPFYLGPWTLRVAEEHEIRGGGGGGGGPSAASHGRKPAPNHLVLAGSRVDNHIILVRPAALALEF